MSLTLLTGGARSGKSTIAVRLARDSGRPVTVIVTGRALDEEMAARIERHRAERPASWTVIEEPIDLSGALRAVAADSFLILDCLTLWVSNLMESGSSDEEIVALSAGAAEEVAARVESSVAVTNEVGAGIVPVSPVGRRFRDVLGIVNSSWVAQADDPFLIVAGKALRLTDLSDA